MSSKIHDLADCGGMAVLSTQAVTAVTTATIATTGKTADFLTNDGQCTLIAALQITGGNTATVAVSVQESTDGTTWTGIAGPTYTGAGTLPMTVQGTTGNSATAAVTAVGFERTKRYLQVIQTTAGTSATGNLSAVLVEQKKQL